VPPPRPAPPTPIWPGFTFAADWLKSAFARENLPDLLGIELSVEEQSEEFGMHGSGMLIINAPWQFREQMQATLSVLLRELSAGCSFSIDSPGTIVTRG
jgi:23S rRNA A2030 N6-methylase RlmJ